MFLLGEEREGNIWGGEEGGGKRGLVRGWERDLLRDILKKLVFEKGGIRREKGEGEPQRDNVRDRLSFLVVVGFCVLSCGDLVSN